MKIDGGCHCGRIRYSAEVLPDQVRVCHCSDCQTLSGSAFRTVVPAIDGSFEFLSGEPKTYIKTAEDGTPRAQVFCPDCGTPIYAGPVGDGNSAIGIRVGSVRQRDLLVPSRQYWCQSAQGWIEDLSSIVKMDN